MANICKICNNSKRIEIDREIVTGKAIAVIAKEFNVSYPSLYSHSINHVTRQLAQAWDKIQLQQNFDMLGRIDKIMIRCEDIFTRNYNAGKDGMALKAVAEERSTIELIAKISYNLHQAKIAELELLKEKSGETKEQAEEDFKKMLVFLNDEELAVFQRIQRKFLNNNNDKIICNDRVLKPNNNLIKNNTEDV
jgi:hypothetical protein